MRGAKRHHPAWAAALVAVAMAALAPAASAGPPQPAKGRGEKCVAETDWMRRYHMTVLNHQRDETVHEGVRGNKFSLKGCIDCHQVQGTDGKPVTVADPKHFCRTCHDYAAVRVDCFDCHASRPGEATRTGATDPHGALPGMASQMQAREQAALQSYLKEVGR
ncbi:MAG: cytochrome c3 family protein [Hyphomicrobiaceae bacterium]